MKEKVSGLKEPQNTSQQKSLITSFLCSKSSNGSPSPYRVIKSNIFGDTMLTNAQS